MHILIYVEDHGTIAIASYLATYVASHGTYVAANILHGGEGISCLLPLASNPSMYVEKLYALYISCW